MNHSFNSTQDKDDTVAELGLLNQIAISAVKKALRAESDDSHHGISIEDFIGLASKVGFREILSENIPGTANRSYLYWQDGLLLRFESHQADEPTIEAKVNPASVYFSREVPL